MLTSDHPEAIQFHVHEICLAHDYALIDHVLPLINHVYFTGSREPQGANIGNSHSHFFFAPGTRMSENFVFLQEQVSECV